MADSDLPIHLQARDLAILRSLFESRVMTLPHVAAFHFEGREEAAKKRVGKLIAARYIAQRRPRVNELAILSLARNGFVLLKSEGILAEYPLAGIPTLEKRAQVAETTIRHELDVLDIKAACLKSLPGKPDFILDEFSTWPALHAFKAQLAGEPESRTIRPDGFIRIRETSGEADHSFFLEADRSSESQDVLVQKCASYMEYLRSGGFALRQGGERHKIKDFPFRVLMVVKSFDRRNNTAERLLQNNPPIRRLVYLSTLAEVKADPFGPVWIRPLDYEAATKDTIFSPCRERKAEYYKRQGEREKLVERTICKQQILSDAVDEQQPV